MHLPWDDVANFQCQTVKAQWELQLKEKDSTGRNAELDAMVGFGHHLKFLYLFSSCIIG